MARTGERLGDAADVGDDLRPEGPPGTTADGNHALDGCAERLERLQVVADAVTDALEQGTEQVGAPVGEAEARDDAAGVRVLDRRPLSAEVGERQQAAGTRRQAGGLVEERGEAGRPVQQGVLEPGGQATCGRGAGSQRVLLREGTARGPDAGVGVRPLGDEDEEGGAAVHDHQIAGRDHADADRLRERVDGAHRHRRAGPEARLGRGGGADLARELVTPSQAREAFELGDPFGEARRPGAGPQVHEGQPVARRVAVHDRSARQLGHQPTAGGVEGVRPSPDVGLVPAQPAQLGADRLAGEGHAALLEHGLRAELGVQLVDLTGGPDVDAVEDALA